MDEIRVLIADDHGILRAGLNALISNQPGYRVVGEAGDGAETLRLADSLTPDVLLMDISMPDIGGIEITKRLKVKYPQLKVLILTVHEDKALLQKAIQAGASGYLIKRALKNELFAALQAVTRGDLYIHSTMIQLMFRARDESHDAASNALETLTPREIDVLKLLAQGYTNSQIAEQLHISLRTVEYHRGNLVSKLQVNSRVDLVRIATEHGLIE